jgi:hypothetical protein
MVPAPPPLTADIGTPESSSRAVAHADVWAYLDGSVDVESATVSMSQPPVWTFLEFEADDDVAGPLAESLAQSLLAEGGWYADFGVGDDHVVMFAHKIFRYQRGRAAAMDYGRAMGCQNTNSIGQIDVITGPGQMPLKTQPPAGTGSSSSGQGQQPGRRRRDDGLRGADSM